MRTARATKKCPASWMRIRKARPKMATAMFIGRWRSSVDELPRVGRCDAARLGFDGFERFQAARVFPFHVVEGALDDLRDAKEREAPVEEGGDGDLVGGVQHA